MPEMIAVDKVAERPVNQKRQSAAVLSFRQPDKRPYSMNRKTLPYGTWKSQISADLVAGGSIRLGGLISDQAGAAYWIESRPAEGGRCVIVKGGVGLEAKDILPKSYSARSKVHEYGGGALLAGSPGALYFTSGDDQDIYCLGSDGDGLQARLTSEPHLRFADYSGCPLARGLYTVTERHGDEGHSVPDNFLSLIKENGESLQVICEGADFYAAPRISPDGNWLAWLEWNLPHMPWQAAALYVAKVSEDGSLQDPTHIVGKLGTPAFQCEWDDEGDLYVVAEKDQWSRLYCWKNGVLSQVSDIRGELARPLWALGMRSYVPLGNKRFAVISVQKGEHCLWLIDQREGTSNVVPQPHRQIFDPVKASGNAIFAIVSDDKSAPAIVEIDMDGNSRLVHRPGRASQSKDHSIKAEDISIGQTLELKTGSGDPLFAVYYPPASGSFRGPENNIPPMICSAHGGPTGSADRGLKLKIQYWTSRGFAFLDVDYRGSTGYGAAYRDALNGFWGIRDAEDMIAAAQAMVDRRLADPNTLLISGGSAGGYTALMALCSGHMFRAACVSYGVADLGTLLDTTHKFEAGYLYGLTGTSPGHTEPVFHDRSPLQQAEKIKNPVLLLQGLDDKVVPPEQSRSMAKAIAWCGVAVSLVEFPGEGHGFRGEKTIIKALEQELAFYAEHLDFPET